MTRNRDGRKLAPVSLRAAIERGALPGMKVGKTWYVSESDLRRYLKSRPEWFKPKGERK